MEKTFNLTINVNKQSDFNKLRALALLADVIDKDELKDYVYKCFDMYYIKNTAAQPLKAIVEEKTMKDFNFWEQDAYDWWYMYCYYEVMIYSNRMDVKNANATFSRSLDKSMQKLSRVISNTTMEMLRTEAINTAKEVADKKPQAYHNDKKLTLHIEFVWKSREDKRVCALCNDLEGTMLDEIPTTMPHLNCRCDFVVFEWWTDEKGNIVADRRYDIEQNENNTGYGYSIRNATITSTTEKGTTVTEFSYDDDTGNTTRTTRKL